MTAITARRRRATKIGAAAAIGTIVIAAGSLALGANLIYNSTDGRSVSAPGRESRPLPTTPNLLLAIVTADDELAAAAVLTLSPAGAGGSIVSIPANGVPVRPRGDAEAQTLRSEYAEGGDDAFALAATSMLGVSFDDVATVDVGELEALLQPVGNIEVELPADVVADDGGTPSVLAQEGREAFDPRGAAEALSAHFADEARNAEMPVADENAAALWEGIADAVGDGLDSGATAGVEVADGPDAFMERLWNGPVSSRSIAWRAFDPGPDDEEPYVAVARNDVVLVFGQVSPRKLSAPTDGISARLVVPFGDADVSNSEVASLAIDNLLFGRINVTSVSTAAADDGAPNVTRVEVLNADAEETARSVLPSVVGDVEIVDGEYEIPGIDVVITLGDSALTFYDEV